MYARALHTANESMCRLNQQISFAQPSTNKAPLASDDYDDIEAVIPATTVRVEPSARDSVKAEAKGSETKSTDTDKKLMPPPSIPLKSQIRLIETVWFSLCVCNSG